MVICMFGIRDFDKGFGRFWGGIYVFLMMIKKNIRVIINGKCYILGINYRLE